MPASQGVKQYLSRYSTVARTCPISPALLLVVDCQPILRRRRFAMILSVAAWMEGAEEGL